MQTPPKFTLEEVAALAKEHGTDLEGMKRRWIIQHGKSFYVLGPEGTYQKPIMASELAQALPKDLCRVPGSSTLKSCGVDLFKKQDDKLVRKPVKEILEQYCGHAHSLVADMSIQKSFYDAKDDVFNEAVCPLADVTPRYHEQIAEWLRLFGGSQHDKLLDWIATLTWLKTPSCGIIITGQPGAGKETFSQGLARRWRRVRAATELSRVLEGFNEDLARCPLVFCDEHMPATRGGTKSALAELMSMVASSTRTLARKFLSNADLVGSVRVVLAANNTKMLESREEQTVETQRAIAIRFLHLKVGEEPGKYLESIGGRRTTEAWVAGGQIAEHAAWLEQTRKVVPGSRFIIEGDATDLQRQIIVNNRNTSLILEWIVRFILESNGSTQQTLIGNSEVLVNSTTISTTWGMHIKSDFVLSMTSIGSALRAMSVKEVRHDWISDGKVKEIRYRSINVEFLYEWSRQNQVGDPEALRQKIQAPLDIDAMKLAAQGGPATPAGLPAGYVRSGAESAFNPMAVLDS